MTAGQGSEGEQGTGEEDAHDEFSVQLVDRSLAEAVLGSLFSVP